MKPLEKEFYGTGSVKGFFFKQLKHNQHAFVYAVYCDISNSKLKPHYEIFEKKISPDATLTRNGITFHCEEAERYPKDNDFGRWAFTAKDFDKAIKIFTDMSKRLESKLQNKNENVY